MDKLCKKCGYERKNSDIAPDYECPNCGAIYKKVEEHLINKKHLENKNKPDINPSESTSISIIKDLSLLSILAVMLYSLYLLFNPIADIVFFEPDYLNVVEGNPVASFIALPLTMIFVLVRTLVLMLITYGLLIYIYKVIFTTIYPFFYNNKHIRPTNNNKYILIILLFISIISLSIYFYKVKSYDEIPFCQGDVYFKAAEKGNINKIKTCLMFGKNINSTLKRSRGREVTALHLAGYSGRYDSAKYLIDNGADINFKSKENGVSPLWYSSSHLKIIKLLVDNGAIINDSRIFTKVVRKTNIETIRYLLSKGANINEEGAFCNAVGAQYKNTIKTVSFLINQGVDVNHKTSSGLTPLHCAMNKRPEVVQLLIKKGANLEGEDKNKRTPIFKANTLFISDLINAGANVNHVSKHGDTPLFISLIQYSGRTVIPLIDGGADINIKNDFFLTPLIVSIIAKKNENSINYLIDSGADKTVSASIDMINEYSELYRKKPIITDKIDLTAHDIAAIKWGINNKLTKRLKVIEPELN